MFNLIGFLLSLFKKHKQEGWVEDTKDEKDYKFEDYFEEDLFGAVLPQEFKWGLKDLPRISHQHSTVSCVINSFDFVNAFHSKQEGNDVFLAWRFPYALIRRLSGGTTFRDNGQHFRKKGVCLDQMMPQAKHWLASNQLAERQRITAEMYSNALTYRIKNYFYIRAWRKEDIKTAVMKAPIIIGVYTNSNAWSKDIIRYDGNKRYGHAICIIGWAKDWWWITDWQGDGTIRKLDINHPLMSAITLLDMPDDVKKLMLKTVKSEDSPSIYVLLRNGEKSHIENMPQYKLGIEKKMWSEYTLETQAIINSYPTSKNKLAFLV